MKPILFKEYETQFRTNGLGRLDPLTCTVTEERNGQYELEMEISIDDPHYSEVKEGRLLYVRHDDTPDKQPFEIYKITRPLNGRVIVLAHHISYRTSKITVMPFTAASCTAALAGLQDHAVGDCPFTFWTDKDVTADFKVDHPVTLRSRLAGSEGSILDVYGTGEYEWDKFNIKLYLHRGSETGAVLRYGKNITELKKTTDASNVWTGVCPFWLGTNSETNEAILVTLPEQVLYTNYVDDYAYKMVVPLDLTSRFQEAPTEEQLRQAAKTYVANNAVTGIPVSIDVSFIALWQTEDYKDVAALQRLHLCDTLTVQYKKLGVENTAKIVKTVYNVILERYDSMTIGEVRSSLASTIGDAAAAVAENLKNEVPTTSTMEQAILAATNLMTGGQGGHVVISRDADGKPKEILVMDTKSAKTATQVLRINMNGIGFSSTGVDGPYRSAWTLDGKFVADFITTGNLNANLMRTGVLTDEKGNNYWDLSTGEFKLAASTKIGDSTVATKSDITTLKAGSIKSVDVEYAQSDSKTKAPEEGWQTNAPAWQEGKYIWQRTATTLADGTVSYSDGLCITGIKGDKGDKGDTGAQGIGISAIVEEYYLSTSDTAQSDGSWSEASPAWSSGHYIWTRSKITWTDGSVTYTTPVLAKAVNGANENAASAKTYADKQDEALQKKMSDSLTQQEIFNRLTNNGAEQGIYLQNGKLYVNGTYLKAGTIDADLIKTGNLLVGGTNKVGEIDLYHGDTHYGIINSSGIDLNATLWGSIRYLMNPDIFSGFSMRSSADGKGKNLSFDTNDFLLKNNDSTTMFGYGQQYAMWIYASDDGVDLFMTGDDTTYPNITMDGGTGSISAKKKSRIIETEDYGRVLTYCYETPSPMFGDVGEGEIGEDGQAYVTIDPEFSETISTAQYQVFLQKYGEGECYVSERHSTYFIVKGTAGLAFGWEIKAKQIDLDQLRLESADPPIQKDDTSYGIEAANYIQGLNEGRVSS